MQQLLRKILSSKNVRLNNNIESHLRFLQSAKLSSYLKILAEDVNTLMRIFDLFFLFELRLGFNYIPVDCHRVNFVRFPK